MKIISMILLAAVAVEHLYILWIEMFAWTTVGRKTFKSLPADLFEKTRKLAANQGLYNGFLSAGLIWSLLVTDLQWSRNLSLFFLGCVTVAGTYGGITAARSIFYIQAVPGIIALIVTMLR